MNGRARDHASDRRLPDLSKVCDQGSSCATLLPTTPTGTPVSVVRDGNIDSTRSASPGGEPLDFGERSVSGRGGRRPTAQEAVSLLPCLWYVCLRDSERQTLNTRAHVTRNPPPVMLLMLLAPQPSWLIILIHHHLLTLRSYGLFAIHLLISYTLLFLACTSLIVCLARDPGPVPTLEDTQDENEETSLAEALMAPVADDFNSPEKWCKKCWAAKPERTHHCSICRRCVLKMGAILHPDPKFSH